MLISASAVCKFICSDTFDCFILGVIKVMFGMDSFICFSFFGARGDSSSRVTGSVVLSACCGNVLT